MLVMTDAPKYVSMRLEERARDQIRESKAFAGGLVRRDVPMSDAVVAMLAVAERYPDEVRAELDRLKDLNK